MRGSEGGEEGRTNSFSGKSTYKKDVREGRERNICDGEGGHTRRRRKRRRRAREEGGKCLWWRGWTHEGEGGGGKCLWWRG